MSKFHKVFLGLLVLSFVDIVGVSYAVNVQQPVFGSVTQSSEYHATTTRIVAGTALGNLVVANTPSGSCALNCPGSLGSVVITGANTGIFNLYDATTSDATKRAGSMATSSILIASFPASAATGTYTFDVSFSNGLLYEVSGSAATSTITFR